MNIYIKDTLVWAEATLNSNPLHAASETGQFEIVAKLLQKKAKITFNAPLIIACKNGHVEVVAELLKAGMNANKREYEDEKAAPLDVAVQYRNVEAVALLLQAGADVAHSNALLIALVSGQDKVVAQLLEAGAELEETLLFASACRGGCVELVTQRLQAGTDVNQRLDVTTPLYLASKGGHTQIVAQLLQAGADVEEGDLEYREQRTPLYIASKKGNAEVVTQLLQAGAKVSKACFNEFAPLFVAGQKGHMEIVKLLVPYAIRQIINESLKEPLHTNFVAQSVSFFGVKTTSHQAAQALLEYVEGKLTSAEMEKYREIICQVPQLEEIYQLCIKYPEIIQKYSSFSSELIQSFCTQ